MIIKKNVCTSALFNRQELAIKQDKTDTNKNKMVSPFLVIHNRAQNKADLYNSFLFHKRSYFCEVIPIVFVCNDEID